MSKDIFSSLNKLLGLSEDEFKKATTPEATTQKLAIVGSTETVKILIDAIKNVTLGSPGVINTTSVRDYAAAAMQYLKILNISLDKYEEEVGLPNSRIKGIDELPDDSLGNDVNWTEYSKGKKNNSGNGTKN